ncbi:MAG: glycoside hydrolase family 43 protein [Acetatifactor sp.]|nr:glycoside hydrolase family 43 protein [Acetatifactor sp.]
MYQNPVLKGYADPDVYYENGTYYMYATSYFVKKGYEVYCSSDLVNWQKRGMALLEAWGFPDKYWAPDVKKIGNRYVMAASVNEHLGLAIADNPAGPFEPMDNWLFDHSIDGHIFIDSDGKLYLYYVSWREGHQYGLYGCELDFETLQAVPDSERLILTPQTSYECHQAPVAEAPYMICKDGKYYLTYSGSHYESPKYCVAVAVSDSPLGRYTRCDYNPVLVGNENVSGCGHHCIVHTPKGEMYLLYHTHANADGQIHPRNLALDRLYWEGDRLVTDGPTITPCPLPDL